MMTVEEITTAVTHLPPEDFSLFHAWYEKFEASLWDSKIEEDIMSGKLDKLANEAIKDFQTYRCTEL